MQMNARPPKMSRHEPNQTPWVLSWNDPIVVTLGAE